MFVFVLPVVTVAVIVSVAVAGLASGPTVHVLPLKLPWLTVDDT